MLPKPYTALQPETGFLALGGTEDRDRKQHDTSHFPAGNEGERQSDLNVPDSQP